MNRRHFLRAVPAIAVAGSCARGELPTEMYGAARFTTQIGLNIGAVDEALRWMPAAPTPHVRLACYWANMLDPRPVAAFDGRTVAEEFHRQAELAVAHGLELVVCVHQTPTSDPYGTGYPAFVADLAARLPESVVLQLGNELNDPVGGWTPRLRGRTQLEWGVSYAALYQATVDALRARRLGHRLVAGGLAGDPRDFLRGMRATNVEPGIVAVHCYGWVARAAVDRARAVRSVMPRALVWLTELGSEAGCASDARQVADLKETVEALDRLPGLVDRAYWYRLQGDPREKGGGFGLISSDGRPRPAWHTFTTLRRAR